MRRERLVQWLATLLPEPIAKAPERILINFACVLIGVSALLSERPGSLLALWPPGFAEAWSLGMAFGGALALTGIWHAGRAWSNSVARLGYLLICVTALIYGVGVIVVFGWQGAASGVVYLGIAFAKAVRLLITSAYRSYLLRGGDAAGSCS